MLDPHSAKIRSFDVVPSLPEKLRPLMDIAYNLWWSWHPEAIDLFRRLDGELFRKTHNNPVATLGLCSQDKLDSAARDDNFMNALNRALENLNRHMTRQPWLKQHGKDPGDWCVAYFCSEFGLAECLQIYSGGLGCLAGDHLKSASELGLPLVGVGLLYRNGFFQQYLNPDGYQQEWYPDLDFSNLPIQPLYTENGDRARVKVRLPGRDVHIQGWLCQVGCIKLYLLDTNVSENSERDRAITDKLYGGDTEHRIQQEIVLGIGGVRMLKAIGVRPDVFHMNEGHSAFLALERIRGLIEERGVNFDEARAAASAGNVFTTHTPVPAGIDRFSPELMKRYFQEYHHALKLDMEGLLALGRENVYRKEESFSMAVLAIRTARRYNGVSKLHGHVSREMWRNIWPGVPEEEIPITHVTNGVHARTWLSPDLINLLERYMGDAWRTDPSDQSVWKDVADIPDEELWRVHQKRKEQLIVWTRRRLRQQLEARGASPEELADASEALDVDALTIGFARRFATYKRGNLILRDQERLLRMLRNDERPLQFIIAGKAHPADTGGKELIRSLVDFTKRHRLTKRFVFVENYDMEVASHLVEGCDVWLNTPKRGMEASGTSGMKAAMNGVLHCSILDGWWDEAYDASHGWAIGRGEAYSDQNHQDDMESRALYDLLENQLIPLYYRDHQPGQMPRNWVDKMKNSLRNLTPQFNTNRMVKEYTEGLYLPALERSRYLMSDNLSKGKELAHRIDKLRKGWEKVKIEEVQSGVNGPLGVREPLTVTVRADLDSLDPKDVAVEAYCGALDNQGRIRGGHAVKLEHHKDLGGGKHEYRGEITPRTSGRHGFAVRAAPGGDVFDDVIEPGLIRWEPTR